MIITSVLRKCVYLANTTQIRYFAIRANTLGAVNSR